MCYELANNGPKNHEQQIVWIINELENIKGRAEKARLKGFDKKESTPDMIKTTLNFIDKKVEENGYNNQYQRERPNNWNKQNYTKYYNNSNQGVQNGKKGSSFGTRPILNYIKYRPRLVRIDIDQYYLSSHQNRTDI